LRFSFVVSCRENLRDTAGERGAARSESDDERNLDEGAW
jgi:hypothetical protein